jgi:hypothetical protein
MGVVTDNEVGLAYCDLSRLKKLVSRPGLTSQNLKSITYNRKINRSPIPKLQDTGSDQRIAFR